MTAQSPRTLGAEDVLLVRAADQGHVTTDELLAVTRAISDHGRTIRLPVHPGDQISKMRRAGHRLTQEFSREPGVDEPATALALPAQRVYDMLELSRASLSTEVPASDDATSELGDFIKDEDCADPDNEATARILHDLLDSILRGLPPREVRILCRRVADWSMARPIRQSRSVGGSGSRASGYARPRPRRSAGCATLAAPAGLEGF